MNTISLELALSKATRKPSRKIRTSGLAMFLQQATFVTGAMAVMYKKGDGVKFGFNCDAGLVSSLNHHGFKTIMAK